MSARLELLRRAGLLPTDQVAGVLTNAEAALLLAMAGRGVGALALRALIYTYLVETPVESAHGRAACRQKEKDSWWSS